MKIVFKDFASESKMLPNGLVVVSFLEAMEGDDGHGNYGIVGTGNEFQAAMTKEVLLNYVVDLAITGGIIPDTDKPEVVDLNAMREELSKRAKGKRGRPKR